ncbi:MAG: molybdopterin-dependent oxidoreductase [Bryobacterales bacterium]|nr:molybdopterin-dependent oxidoreductase [Bryobacterales bacterium]
MNTRRLLGIDTLAEKYSYGYDPEHGYTSEQKIPEHWVKTTCGYCSVGCGMKIGVKDGVAVTVRGDESHPVNEGKLCPKGLSEHYTLQASNRAQYPLLRKNGSLARVSWDEALETMAVRFRETQARYGANSVGVLSTGQLVTEEFYTLGKLVQLGIGTKNYDGNTTLCMASAVAGYKRSFGSDGPPGAYEDFELADVIVLIGANIADNHPILCQKLERNRNKKLIVVDPRVTKTAMLGDLHLPLKPRTDIALLQGIAHMLIRDGKVDREYVAAHTTGFEEVARQVEKYTPEFTAAITGVPVDLIEQAAAWIGEAGAPFFAWTMGVNHSTQGAETVNVICNLSLMLGKVGTVGASPFSITGQCNAMGTREAGFASSLPGYRKFENAADRAELAQMWGVDESRIPTSRGFAYPDVIEAVLKKQIRALWIIATNPLVSFPNQELLERALENLDFLVVQDGFHPTPTTERADLVLPAAIWGEKEGTYTNSERRVSKANKAVDAPGEAISDFEIFLRLADQLGVRQELFGGWTKPEDAFNEWRRVSKGRLCDYSGISYALLDEGPVQWPYVEGADAFQTRRLYSDGKFETADGKAKFLPVEWQPFPEQPNREYPLILNTGRTVEHWHTRTKTGQVAILERMSPRAWLEMNPYDAIAMGFHPHDRVDVVSRRGRVSNIELRVTGIVAPGQVFLPFHYVEFNSNNLTQSAYDPISREPNFKQSAVRVERTGASR